MKTVLWQQPDNTLALTTLFETDGGPSEPEEMIQLLTSRGDIPKEWSLLGYNIPWPETGWPHETHRFQEGKIVVDFGQAKLVTKDRLRKERTPLLAKLDVDYMRALEAGGDTSAITTQKQALRDLPDTADTCTTLSQLKALKASL